jgi:hypothetical protein
MKSPMKKQTMAEEYLDLNQLIERVPLSKTTIEEQIAAGHLVEGVHFRRPTGPRGKRLFFMSAIDKWLRGQDFDLRRNHLVRQNTKR